MRFESPKSPRESEEPKRDDKKDQKGGFSRRQFLKLAGKAALGTAAAGVLPKLEKIAEAFQPLEKEKTIEQFYQDWQELKKVVSEDGVEVNIQYLKDKLGNAPQLAAFLFKPLFDFQLIKEIKRREAAGEDLRKIEAGQNLLKQASETYQYFWYNKAIDTRLQNREAKEGLSASFEGFEKLADWFKEKILPLLESRFDKRWLYGNISKFIYLDRSEKQAHYEVAGRAEGRGIQAVLIKGERQTVTIYWPPPSSTYQLLRTIAHEIGHHQDWENNNRLPIQERLLFLKEVTEHLNWEKGKRLWTRYVDEDIPKEYYYYHKKAHPHEISYRQAQEYWATIAEWYTTDPEGLRRLFPQDYILAEKWYQRLTRPFNEK